jgi:hypothetical protein
LARDDKELQRCIALLRKLEWITFNITGRLQVDFEVCVVCGKSRRRGHADDCELDAILDPPFEPGSDMAEAVQILDAWQAENVPRVRRYSLSRNSDEHGVMFCVTLDSHGDDYNNCGGSSETSWVEAARAAIQGGE